MYHRHSCSSCSLSAGEHNILLLAASTPASPCHSKKVSHSSALVVFIPGVCSYTVYSCCCCCLYCCLSSGCLAFHLFQRLYHYISYSIQAPADVLLRIFLRFTYCVRCPRTAVAAAAAAAVVSCHGFSKVGLPEAANNHCFFGRLAKPDFSHNNPAYLCPTLNTLYQVTPRK